jgi:hypothetical protein
MWIVTQTHKQEHVGTRVQHLKAELPTHDITLLDSLCDVPDSITGQVIGNLWR